MSITIGKEEVSYEFSFLESDDSLLNYGGIKKRKNKKKKSTEKLIVVLIFLAIIIILEFFFGRKAKYVSLLLFANDDYKRCIILNKLDLYKYNIRYAFIFIMYSFMNIYAVFCYMVADIVSIIGADIIRLSIFEPRPFWENNNIFPCECKYSPSSPSLVATNSFLFFSLSFFYKYEQKLKNKLNSNNYFSEPKKFEEDDLNNIMNISSTQLEKKSDISRIIVTVFIIALIIFVDLIPLFQNIEYLHQTIFGVSLSFSLYYLIFHVLSMNHISSKQFIKIINQPFIILTFSLILIFLIFFILNNMSFLLTPSQIVYIEKFCHIPDDYNLASEILQDCSLIFEVLGTYIAFLLEYNITFKKKQEKFLAYNIKSKDKDRYNENCGVFKKIVIFLFLFLIEYVLFKMIIEFFIKNYLEGTIKFAILSFELFLKGIFYFYVMKRLLTKIGLMNDKIFKVKYKPIFNFEDD